MSWAVKYVSIKKFSELSGYTEDAIRTKIRDGVWLEGKVWIKALDGRNLINIEGYEEWVEMAAVFAKHQERAMKSPLHLKGRVVASGSNLSPVPLTANA